MFTQIRQTVYSVLRFYCLYRLYKKKHERSSSLNASSYLYNNEIKSLFSDYVEYIYITYYIEKDENDAEKLKKALVELINPPITIYEMEKGGTEDGFPKK